jgi:quercetin dioxygenase-like cupin family protein
MRMALQHAKSLDVIDVSPLGAALVCTVTHSLLKTPTLQLMRVVLRAGASLPEHSVAGAITVQCIEGLAVVSAGARQCHLAAGQLVMLEGHESHAVQATTDCSLLVSVLLHTAPA